MVHIKHKDLDTYAKQHFEAMEQHISKKKFTQINNWFKSNGSKTFKDVITSKCNTLKQIKDEYKMDSYPNYINYLMSLYDRFANSSEVIGDNGYNGAELIKKLEITVCPYCNRSYINNVECDDGKGERKIKRTSQFDHFYNQKDYPFLAMSFYNLIPVCSSCNRIKSTSSITVSPYDEKADIDKLITFDYEIDKFKGLSSKDEIVVTLESKDEIKKNVEILGLKSLYESHKDVVYDILMKCKMYDEGRIKEIMDTFTDLFKGNRDEVERIIFGNYIKDDEVHKRPLAKLTKDIYTKYRNKLYD